MLNTSIFYHCLKLLLFLTPFIALFTSRWLGVAPLILGLYAWAIYLKSEKRPSLNKPFMFFFITVILFGFLSMLWGLDTGAILKETGELVLFTFGFTGIFIGVSLLPKERFSDLLKCLPLSVALTALLILIEFYFDLSLHRAYQSFSEKSNHIGLSAINRGQVLLAIWLWPMLWLLPKTYKNYATLVFSLLVLSAIFFAKSSQGAAFAVTISGAAWLISRIYNTNFILKAFFIAIALIILAMPFITEMLYIYAEPWLSVNLKAAAASERLFIWHITVDHIVAQPFLGYGFDAIKHLSPSYIEQAVTASHSYLSSVDIISHPHNFALQIWLEMGLVGILLILFNLFWLYKKFEQMPHSLRPNAIASFASILSVGAVNYGMWQGWWLGLIFMTVLVVNTYKMLQN